MQLARLHRQLELMLQPPSVVRGRLAQGTQPATYPTQLDVLAQHASPTARFDTTILDSGGDGLGREDTPRSQCQRSLMPYLCPEDQRAVARV
jgi:hypothetical protein